MTRVGETGLQALRELVRTPGGVSGCDERLLEKVLRLVLNDVVELSLQLTKGRAGTWTRGTAGWLPDLFAEDADEGFLAGLEVKTRAGINWGEYGTPGRRCSQLDRYAERVDEIGASDAPLYLVVGSANEKRVRRQLEPDAESRIESGARWRVLSLEDLLHFVPEHDPVAAEDPALVLLLRLLAQD